MQPRPGPSPTAVVVVGRRRRAPGSAPRSTRCCSRWPAVRCCAWALRQPPVAAVRRPDRRRGPREDRGRGAEARRGGTSRTTGRCSRGDRRGRPGTPRSGGAWPPLRDDGRARRQVEVVPSTTRPARWPTRPCSTRVVDAAARARRRRSRSVRSPALARDRASGRHVRRAGRRADPAGVPGRAAARGLRPRRATASRAPTPRLRQRPTPTSPVRRACRAPATNLKVTFPEDLPSSPRGCWARLRAGRRLADLRPAPAPRAAAGRRGPRTRRAVAGAASVPHGDPLGEPGDQVRDAADLAQVAVESTPVGTSAGQHPGRHHHR